MNSNEVSPCLMQNLLKLVDVFCKVVYHEFRVLQDDVCNESVFGHLYLQLFLRLSQSNNKH